MPKFLRLQILPLLLSLAGLLCPTQLFGQLTSQGNEQVVNYTGSNAGILSNTPVNPNLLTGTGTNTFILNVNPPTNSLRAYITNDTANACANLTFSIASAGNNSLNSFNNNLAAWQTVQVTTGGSFASSSNTNLPANGTVAITSAPIIGTKIAVFLVLSAGCASTNVDFEIVFGTFSPTNSQIQGALPAGGIAANENPVVIAGANGAGGIQVPQIPTIAGSSSGFAIGGFDAGPGATYTTERMPGGSTDGPLSSAIYAKSASSMLLVPVLATAVGSCTTTAPCSGMLTSDAGFFLVTTLSAFSTTQVLPLWINPTAQNSIIESCHFSLHAINNSGTTPTLDVFIQDSWDQSHWTDRIHFTQVTTPPSDQVAGIGGSSANLAVAALTSRTIAAGTIVSGPLDAYGQIVFVLGGTSPNYTATLAVNCK